ncbi:MAG TPA: ABC transporter ATP-binding protein [Gemmatimonadaceae bacterium]|jgi:lipopolysaccharide transport system ATP-binding protein
MSAAGDAVLAMEQVSKKFRRGEMYDSLRDLIPALVTGLWRRSPASALATREFWALEDVSFSVQRGEAFGIIGSNGAGKSTILKLLSGIMRPTSGNIVVRGKLSALIEVSAGFHPDLTGEENIYLNGTILGMTRDEIRRKFDDIVEFAGLSEFIDTPVKRYSSGMFARLGFSVAAHVEPDLLIVDEVLSVGDYLFQQKCVDRMNEVLKGGATIVFVSHNLHAVASLCRRSLLLEKGRVVTCTYTDEVIRQYLERAKERSHDEGVQVEIRKVTVRHANGGSGQFASGETACVDVTLGALVSCDDVTTVIQIVDDNFYPIFDTDTARLSGAVSSLRAGEQLESTFTLELHLGAGTYHVNAFAHEYITNRAFSTWRSAATFFVGETRTVKGRVNLYPGLERHVHVAHASSAAGPSPTRAVTATAPQ